MNGYAIQLGFTGKRAEELNEVYRYFDSPVLKVLGAPQLSLAVFEKDENRGYIEAATSFAASTSLKKIAIEGVGSFPGSGHIAYLKVALDALLKHEHLRLHSELGKGGMESLTYYRPGQWIPHLTLTMEDEALQKRVLAESDNMDFCCDIEIGSVRVIKFMPVEVLAIIPMQSHLGDIRTEAVPKA